MNNGATNNNLDDDNDNQLGNMELEQEIREAIPTILRARANKEQRLAVSDVYWAHYGYELSLEGLMHRTQGIKDCIENWPYENSRNVERAKRELKLVQEQLDKAKAEETEALPFQRSSILKKK